MTTHRTTPDSPSNFDFSIFFRQAPEITDEKLQDPFLNFCHRLVIIKELINIKCKRVQKRRKALSEGAFTEKTRSISSVRKQQGWDRLFHFIFPSRKEVGRLTKDARWEMIVEARRKKQVVDESAFYRESLARTIDSGKFRNRNNLLKFCEFIRKRIANIDRVGIQPPRLIISPKKGSKHKKLEKKKTVRQKFRVLSIYNEIDGLILSLVARYFRKRYDRIFTKSALAFRAREKCDHNEAFDEIIRWTGDRNRKIYFFEYDFKSFYDSIPHDVILEEFGKLHEEYLNGYGAGRGKSDIAQEVLKQYLDTYNFSNVLEKIFIAKSIGFFEEALDQYDMFSDHLAHGIPQGTALSCFLSNVVLHRIDKKMREHFKSDKKGENGLFLRFCDDSIVLSTNRRTAERAERIFKKCAYELKLQCHPAHDQPYGEGPKKYWENKSKTTRPWGDPNKIDNAAPFLSFVGYRLHFSKQRLSIRPTSIRKEIVKQRRLVNKAIRSIKQLDRRGRKSRLRAKDFFRSVVERLCAMSVGYTHVTDELGKAEKCWVDGWDLFYKHPEIPLPEKQLRHLSARRNWAIRKAKWFMENNRKMFSRKRTRGGNAQRKKIPMRALLCGKRTYRKAMEFRRMKFNEQEQQDES